MKLFSAIFVGLLAFANAKRNGRGRNAQKSGYRKNRIECYDFENPAGFNGETNVTVYGEICQNWSADHPNRPKVRPSDSKHNFCRNPDNDPNGPWCYTQNANIRYQYCHVKHCSELVHEIKSKSPGKTCLPSDDLNGLNYEGHDRFALVGGKKLMCQSWAAVEPHRSMYLQKTKHNYCRNPNNDSRGPWCYLQDKAHAKGYCTGIPLCDANATRRPNVRRRECGMPKIQAEFSKAKQPTVLRTRRDISHVQNADEKYNIEDYYYYGESESSESQTPRRKTFVHDLQEASVADVKSRIIKGEEVVPNSFPWQISIRYSTQDFSFCGGSVISEKWVLTAAHCVMDEAKLYAPGNNCFASDELIIHAGSHTKAGNTPSDQHLQSRSVKKFCMHPKWDKNNIYGDAALLELSKNLVINDYVMPICLPELDTTVLPDTMCVITGFGRTQGTANEKVLNQQTLPIVSNTKCNKLLGAGTVPKDNSQMCAGFDEGGVDTCQGDSGGPLACKHGDQWFIDGVTSWGFGCGLKNSPGVYTRVSNAIILSWVKDLTKLE